MFLAFALEFTSANESSSVSCPWYANSALTNLRLVGFGGGFTGLEDIFLGCYDFLFVCETIKTVLYSGCCCSLLPLDNLRPYTRHAGMCDTPSSAGDATFNGVR